MELGEIDSDRAPGIAASNRSTHGLSYRSMTDQLARELGLDENPGGAVVTRVDPLSAVADAGLRARDVIVEVDGVRVSDASDLDRRLERADLERGVRLTVLTDGVQRFVFFKDERR